VDFTTTIKEIGRQHGHNMENVDLIVTILYYDSEPDFEKQFTMLSLLATCFPQVALQFICIESILFKNR